MSQPTSEREQIMADAARLLAVKDRLGSAWSSENEAQLQTWLARDLRHRVAWLQLQDSWRRANVLAETAAPRPSLRGRTFGLPRWRAFNWPIAAMASLLLAATLTLILGRYARDADPIQQAELSVQPLVTNAGERRAITMPDGSKVTLNARSRARTDFSNDARLVWLEEGEAFFDVQRDPNRPFVVYAGKDRIMVLGTRFSVRLQGDTTVVLVQEGRVRVERAVVAPLEPAPLLLQSGAEASLHTDSVLLQQRTPEAVSQALNWREGRLTFKDRALGEVAADFNRYHQRQLVVDPAVSGMRISGTFDIDNLDGFTRLMHHGFGLTVRVEGSQLFLEKR